MGIPAPNPLFTIVALPDLPDRGHGPGACHGPGHGRGPSCGHVQAGPDCRPRNLGSTALHRNEVAPIQPPGTVAESSNPYATCNAFSSPDTNNHLPTRTRGLVLEAGLPQWEAVAGQL
jgi:hypothetical protein